MAFRIEAQLVVAIRQETDPAARSLEFHRVLLAEASTKGNLTRLTRRTDGGRVCGDERPFSFVTNLEGNSLNAISRALP